MRSGSGAAGQSGGGARGTRRALAHMGAGGGVKRPASPAADGRQSARSAKRAKAAAEREAAAEAEAAAAAPPADVVLLSDDSDRESDPRGVGQDDLQDSDFEPEDARDAGDEARPPEAGEDEEEDGQHGAAAKEAASKKAQQRRRQPKAPSRPAGEERKQKRPTAAGQARGRAQPRVEAPLSKSRQPRPSGKVEASAKWDENEDGHLDEQEDAESDGEDDDARVGYQDFSSLALKADHTNRPLWVCSDGRVFLETFSSVYRQAYDFMIAVAEPVCRPEAMHEYKLTPHSLYAAVSVGLETSIIITVLNRLSKNELPEEVVTFIKDSTENYGKVKLVLKENKFFVESEDPAVLTKLLEDDVISAARIMPTITELGQPGGQAKATPAGRHEAGSAAVAGAAAAAEQAASLTGDMAAAFGGDEGGFLRTAAPAQMPLREAEAGLITDQQQEEIDAQRELDESAAGPALPTEAPAPAQAVATHSFEIEAAQVEHVKARCLPHALNYPMMEEYDFANDTANKDLEMDLKPMAQLRPYQEKSLAKMFGNGRARSGIIVLPCGAGKSLVGVAAACRVRKSILVLCTSSVSVDQWRMQFKLWSTIPDRNISRFISESKEMWQGDAGVTVTTYNMVAFSGRRSEEAQKVMDAITSREWGLMVLDEVHVVPAHMFRKVIGITKAHCKLGLTATLVREDELIADLNFLIGPKLYEANWLDLQENGYIARVQCVEVWCEMTPRFYRAYLSKEYAQLQQALYVMNPNKYAAAEFLVRYHEQQCGDKVIVFSDNVHALKEYAIAMRKPFIYGPTPLHERNRILYAFKHSSEINTIFLSKVGDNSIDIPEANVIIQISSHAGSRRQEAQRLGRILRAKQNTRKGEYNAFFYSLVSKDTAEMVYSARRQQFLIDQGYAFKVITKLSDSNSKYQGTEMETDVLKKLLAARADEAGIEELPLGADDLVEQGAKMLRAAPKKAPKARRVKGSMAALSGAAGLSYREYATGKGKEEASKKKRHALFAGRKRL